MILIFIIIEHIVFVVGTYALFKGAFRSILISCIRGKPTKTGLTIEIIEIKPEIKHLIIILDEHLFWNKFQGVDIFDMHHDSGYTHTIFSLFW